MVQPRLSVTVTEYVPAFRLEIPEVVAPVFHEYVYGAVPPVADVDNAPVDCPKQLT